MTARSLSGTFLQTVRLIPKGRVATYGSVAAASGFPGAARQVAWALHAAKTPVPWQRVVGAGGQIRLPAEKGREQRLRLEQEGISFQRGKIPMRKYEFQFQETS